MAITAPPTATKLTKSFFAKIITKPVSTQIDFKRNTVAETPPTDNGTVPIIAPKLPAKLASQEQEILHELRENLGGAPFTERQLQCAPQRLVQKAIGKEKVNYAENEAYAEVNIKQLPKNANLISSHHFFQIKNDFESNKLKLNCRLVPHGNRDNEKDEVRKDSSTAQFPVIRAMLSACVILGFRLASIDISGAYLQSKPLTRDV